MNRSLLTASISAIALLTAGGSLAQTSSATPLSVGRSVTAVLDNANPSMDGEDGSYRYEDYGFSASAGQRLEAVMRAEDFDAYLSVYRAGDITTPFASDDDGLGEGTDSRLRFVAPEAGRYILRARTLGGLEGGAYSLSLSQRAAAPRAPRPTPLSMDRPVNGTIGSRDPEDDNGIRFDAYSLRLASGQRIAVSMEAEDGADALDPVLRIGRMVNGSFIELAMNDDKAGGGLGSRLIFNAPSAGDYVVRAAGYNDTAAGAYTLTLTEGPPPLSASPIAIGETVEGELSSDDGTNDNGQRTDAFSFEATAGQRVTITLDSDDFDAYLELFGPEGESLGEDDDGGDEGMNSRLTRTLAETGTYVVQARALGDDGTGSYSIALTEAAPVPQPLALAIGETLQGEIMADGPRDDDGRNFVAYRFQGMENTRAQVIVRSGDFDTFVQLGRAGDIFESLVSDDDGLGEGTDSRLTFKLPSDGEYEVRVSPLGADGKGLYSVELLDKGPEPLPGSILIGATARASLSDNDALTSEGVFHDDYRIQIPAGEKLNITMVSNDFDSFVELGREKSDGEFESLASDDDGLSDVHAKLEWTADRAGAYVIRARSYGPGQTGGYTLTVERKP